MASRIPRHIMRNCTVYMGRDRSKIGQASEMQTPNIKLMYEDVRNAGMAKARAVLMGFEVEDADVKMTSLDPETLEIFGGSFGVERDFLFVGDLADEDGKRGPCSYYVRGQISELDFDNWKPGNLHSHGYMIKPYYGKFEYQDRVLIEWDDYDLTVDGKPMFNTLASLLAI